jgi:hypothetical protein
MLAPKDTPQTIVGKLNAAVNEAMRGPPVAGRR